MEQREGGQKGNGCQREEGEEEGRVEGLLRSRRKGGGNSLLERMRLEGINMGYH